MYNLLEFLRKYYYVFLFLLLEGISLAFLFRFNSYQGHIWLSSANATVASIDGIYSEALSYLQLRDVNRALTDENLRLQRENELLQEALTDATKDTTLTERLMRNALKDYKLIPAKVVSNSNERANNYLVINRGESDGVRPEMGVVGGGGIVGIVYLTGERHSLVIPVTNKKSSISCRVRGQRYFGYLQWDGKSLRKAFVDDIPRYAHVKKGECVETSGYSSVFPPGIFVGRIGNICNSPDGQSYKLDINLGTNFANLRDVNVIATPYKAEIDTLRAHAAEADANGRP
ncbi:MAG: rod shape-determining protein MreC [Bacteroidaceae bacterium]|nr:rod shape-determining protein MreC [Bacteroidaceae bacterium]